MGVEQNEVEVMGGGGGDKQDQRVRRETRDFPGCLCLMLSAGFSFVPGVSNVFPGSQSQCFCKSLAFFPWDSPKFFYVFLQKSPVFPGSVTCVSLEYPTSLPGVSYAFIGSIILQECCMLSPDKDG